MLVGTATAEQEQAVSEVSQLLHIEQLLGRKPGQLSGGQRQRVAMGRALVRKPEVFLFDEPLSNLDAKLRIEMRTEIKKLHQRPGKTTIYVTHDQVEAMTLASRIAVMDNGHIRQFGPPAEIYENPKDLFVAGFMGSPSMNLVRGTIMSTNGSIEVVVSDDEGTVAFPLPPVLATKVKGRAGQPVDLGLRPEIITHPGAHPADASVFSFERAIDVVEPTGPDTMLVFTLGGVEAIGRVRSDESVEAGRPYRFQVNMDKAKLFDPETGVRL
jgi:multiple sugar transport system ATP-binding protein